MAQFVDARKEKKKTSPSEGVKHSWRIDQIVLCHEQ